jgi:hypothetical protein
MDPHHPESEVPPPSPSRVEYCLQCGCLLDHSLGLERLCLTCEQLDTERSPPMTDSEKLDRILGLCERLWLAQQADHQLLEGLRARLRLLETAHNYRHPEDADRRTTNGPPA